MRAISLLDPKSEKTATSIRSTAARYVDCLGFLRRHAVSLGIQNLGQLDEIYGANITKVIVDLCSTKVCFRQTSPELDQRMSKAFGEKEALEIQEGISYGANDIRDRVNLSMVTKEKQTIPPTEIFAMDNLEAYVKLAGNLPVTKIKFKYKIEQSVASSFVKKV